jgi:hypothetical protein
VTAGSDPAVNYLKVRTLEGVCMHEKYITLSRVTKGQESIEVIPCVKVIYKIVRSLSSRKVSVRVESKLTTAYK